MAKILHNPFEWKDIAGIAVGAVAMGFPVAVTEEVWNLSAELSLARVFLMMLGCLVVIGTFVYFLYYHGQFDGQRLDFVQRVVVVYTVTLGITALLLWGINRLPFETDPALAFKRCVLVAIPGSFTATIVDSLH